MLKKATAFIAAGAVACSLLLGVGAASAQATRTFVSGVGDDANPCSRTAPCKTFAGAIAKTAPSGEIDCLDPGGFGAVTITKAMTIDCLTTGGVGGVLVAGTNGIVVSVPAGTLVQLIGLDFDGIGGVGLSAVTVTTGGNVMIADSLIYGFGSGGVAAVLMTDGTAGTHILLENDIIRNNLGPAVNISPTGGVTNSITIDHSVLESNTTSNLVTGTGGTAVLNASVLSGVGNAVNDGGATVSYGNNLIRGTVTGNALTTTPLQ
jgi:hypothetical protein